MSNFNIRCIQHIITYIEDEEFGTFAAFCQFYVCVSAKFSFLNFCCAFQSAKTLSCYSDPPFCIVIRLFWWKNGLKAAVLNLWHCWLLGPFCCNCYTNPLLKHIAICISYKFLLGLLQRWTLCHRISSLCSGSGLTHG